MQAIILAAGMGKRLSDLTKDNTKCMVPVHDHLLIDYLLDSISDVDLERIVIVVGYKAEGVINYLGSKYKNIPIHFVHNPDYNTTNNIYSLYLAKDYLQTDDTILLESDLIYDKKIIERLVSDPRPNLAVVDKYKPWMDGTVVKLDEDENIVNFIPKKEFNYAETDQYYKTVNIYKFSKKFSKEIYYPFLKAYSTALGLNEYYEQVLRVIAFIDKYEVKAMPLNGEKWYEIDDKQDLDNAKTVFSPKEKKLSTFQKRYGGYWRYPELLDFCYLVNPYFPPVRMEEEIKNYFHRLLREYPSGASIQGILAATMFNCRENQILVGNGAAELIPALMQALPGKIGIITPTFNEYPERIAKDKLITFSLPEDDFSYGIDFIIEQSSQIDSFILINPDNPSGNLIPKEELLKLIAHFKKENKTLLVDESFVDFSEGNIKNSLICPKLMDENPHLIVVKSISKSYGVPGLRLGVMATSNLLLLETVKKNLSIWNINSFGEFFLQIIDKYQKDYINGCEMIANERTNFIKQLETIKYLKPLPSQANYILCRVTGQHSSTELTTLLLDKYEIFIKDLTGKAGFPKSNYVRIAVRDRNDNNKLINALREL
ncbi:aminotransferase class I/II-fold pyridoxal phosphate-dependent enzyme [Marinilabiliaceae bacterium JC017]|nr:aminotransferase class I/II-fold pyridoxal phosphate-dependent enzyme [Marinilabiliaceae bacterium JC017]